MFQYEKLDPENDWVKLAALHCGMWRRSSMRPSLSTMGTRLIRHGWSWEALADSSVTELQQSVAGQAREQPILAISHRHEGIRAMPVRGIHPGCIPETVQRGRPDGHPRSLHSKAGDRENG